MQGREAERHARGIAPHREEIFERHEMGRLPVIFHTDTLTAGHNYSTNWHENMEILLFLSGRGRVYCEDAVREMQEGDIAVIGSGMLHRVESDEGTRYHCLIPDLGFLHKNGIHPDRHRFPLGIRDETLSADYRRVAEAFATADAYRECAVRGALLTFTVELLRRFGEEGEAQKTEANAPVRNAIDYIRAHYTEPLEIDTLATVAGLSKFHFIREFKRVTGQTAVTYINTVRTERAAMMLREGSVSVSEVAAACGFSSHSYFSKVFFRHRGILPSALLEKPE